MLAHLHSKAKERKLVNTKYSVYIIMGALTPSDRGDSSLLIT